MNWTRFNQSNLNTTSGHVGRPVCLTSTAQRTLTEFHLIVTAGIVMAVAIMVANIANLVVFSQWKKKHPFLHFHVALSYAELGYGCVLLFAPASYLFDTQQVFSWPKKVTTGGIPIFAHICHSLLASMSIDRWLSTEFPVVYKNTISTRKVTIIIAIIWMYYLCQYTTVYLLFRGSFQMTCQSVVFFGLRAKWWSVLTSMQYPIWVSIMGLTQMRIAMLAVQAKIRVMKNRLIVNITLPDTRDGTDGKDATVAKTSMSGSTGATGRLAAVRQVRSAGVLLRTMWKTVLAGSVVVVVAICCNVPVIIVTESGMVQLTATTRTVAYLVSNFQYLSPTVSYLLFYGTFRRCIVEICRVVRAKLGLLPR